MKKILIRLNNLTKKQLNKICKRMKIKCPNRKQDIVNKLLQPLRYQYKMKSKEQKQKERKEARELKQKERKEARELKQKERKKSRELKQKERKEAREANKIERTQIQKNLKIEREIKRQERQRLIDKWKQEGKDNLEIVELLMQMNISQK